MSDVTTEYTLPPLDASTLVALLRFGGQRATPEWFELQFEVLTAGHPFLDLALSGLIERQADRKSETVRTALLTAQAVNAALQITADAESYHFLPPVKNQAVELFLRCAGTRNGALHRETDAFARAMRREDPYLWQLIHKRLQPMTPSPLTRLSAALWTLVALQHQITKNIRRHGRGFGPDMAGRSRGAAARRRAVVPVGTGL